MSDQGLLPPNRTRLEAALEQAMAPALSPEDIATLWDPHRCPAKALPWLAWALHVDDWRDDWTESVKRQVIAASVPVHRAKGTLASVRRLLSAFGVSAVVREWWQTGGTPHTFEIDILASAQYTDSSAPILGPALTERMQSLINATKPVRSHYTLSVGALYDARLAAGGMLRRPTQMTEAGATQPPPAPLSWQALPAYGQALRRPATVLVGAAGQPAPAPITAAVELSRAQSMPRPAALHSITATQQPGRNLSQGRVIGGAISRGVTLLAVAASQSPGVIALAARQLAASLPRPTVIAAGSGTLSI